MKSDEDLVKKCMEYRVEGSKRHSLQAVERHGEPKLLCKLCRTSPPPAMGARFTVFLGMPAMRIRWMAGAVAHKSE